MSTCDRCHKEDTGGVYIGKNSKGYKFLCWNCHDIVIDEEELKSPEELDTMDKIRELNPKLMVRNFVKYLCEYQKNPTKETYDILWRIMCWAGHEDHTASCAIHEICKLQKFDFYTEQCKLKGEN